MCIKWNYQNIYLWFAFSSHTPAMCLLLSNWCPVACLIARSCLPGLYPECLCLLRCFCTIASSYWVHQVRKPVVWCSVQVFQPIFLSNALSCTFSVFLQKVFFKFDVNDPVPAHVWPCEEQSRVKAATSSCCRSLTCDPALRTARLMEWMLPPPLLVSTNRTSSTVETAVWSTARSPPLPPSSPTLPYFFRLATPCRAWFWPADGGLCGWYGGRLLAVSYIAATGLRDESSKSEELGTRGIKIDE